MDATQATEKTFTSLVSELDYPMFIVTTVSDEGERSGCLIGFATQISIKPPRFLTGLSHKNHTYRVLRDAEHVGVHFVPEDGNDLAELFGGETGDEVDKFSRCRWHEGPGGVPMLDELPNRFVGLYGTQAQIDAAQAAAHVALAEDEGHTHSAQVLLYGPDDYARVSYAESDNESDAMAHDLPIVVK